MKKLSLLSLVLLLAVTITASAAAQPADGVLLRYGGDRGDVLNYRMMIKANTVVGAMGDVTTLDTKTDLNMTQRVLEKDDDDTMFIMTSTSNTKTLINGEPTTQPQAETVFTLRMNPAGEVSDVQGLPGVGSQHMQLKFPEKKMKMGDSWESVTPASEDVPVDLKMKYTIREFRTIAGRNCVIINSSVASEKTDQGAGSLLSVKATGQIMFDYESGIIVRNAVQGEFDQVTIQEFGEEVQPIVTKVEIEMTMELEQ